MLGPPGAYVEAVERWGRLEPRLRTLPEASMVVVDARVARLHPLLKARRRQLPSRQWFELAGGERAKTFGTLERVLRAAAWLPRSGTLVAIGGGTIGDLCTVAAHLLKRGVSLVHVPSTLLAAVDSSMGGKGAVDLLTLGGPLKNAAGVFHYAAECWLCPELFTTLSTRQLREGAAEAWKMVLTLDGRAWRAALDGAPWGLARLIRHARSLKARVCALDPYDRDGRRQVLNFGHTFGHVLESVSRFRLAHGEAVGLGMRCALDVGVALGITDPADAAAAESGLERLANIRPRAVLATYFSRSSSSHIESLLLADKKNRSSSELTMVLLERVGRAGSYPVGRTLWRRLLRRWSEGRPPLAPLRLT